MNYLFAKNFKDFSEGYNSVFKPSWQIKKFAGKLKQIVALLTGCTVEQLEDNDFKNQKLSKEWNIPLSYLTNDDRDYDQTVKYTYRKLLQNVGTEAMRNTIHPNIWVNALFADYKCNDCNKTSCYNEKDTGQDICNFPNWIITDLRFPNELKAVKDRSGITIRCNRSLQNIKGVKAIDSKDDEKVKELMKSIELIKSGNAKINSKGMIGTEGNDIAYNSMFNDHPSETALDNATFDYVLDNNSTIEELVEQIKQILIEEKII